MICTLLQQIIILKNMNFKDVNLQFNQ